MRTTYLVLPPSTNSSTGTRGVDTSGYIRMPIRMAPQKLMLYHDAIKLAIHHNTDIHINHITHICVYVYIHIIHFDLFIRFYTYVYFLFFNVYIYIYIKLLYTMGCSTIFFQSHYDCRDRGEDASTNAVRMDLKKSMALWLRASMLDTQRRWQMSSRCRVGVGVAWISHVPSMLNSCFWLSATAPGLGNQAVSTSDPLSKLMLQWKMNTDGESTRIDVWRTLTFVLPSGNLT